MQNQGRYDKIWYDMIYDIMLYDWYDMPEIYNTFMLVKNQLKFF